ncbi:MAG: lytic transglycosylase domain-containing protein, partial [Myxococcales bacterium]|nr:lytic transglycosylase domain-containing protein [Myxococcales bacterium]
AVAERLPRLEAQALRTLGQVDEALAAYARGAEAAGSPAVKGRLAYEGARLARKLNRVDAATVGLLEVAVAHLHPTGEAKARAWALWSLGFVAWRNGQLPTAERVWAQLIEQHPMAQDSSRRTYYERALYWQARAWAQMGRVEAARRQWRFVRDRFPYSYYAVLAHHRLPDGDVWASPAASVEAEPPASVPLAHADAVWLWRLGLVRDARDTLRHRENLGALDHSARQLLSAAYRARNDWYRSHWILQHHDPLDAPAVGADRARWLAAYPRPFEKAVRHQAQAHGVDPLLIWAVMRQESGFRPRVGSPAGALGLMQVLPATAAGMARRLKERRVPGPTALRRVWPNVHYGAAFLARLQRRYRGHLALTLAAYNAGPGHVDDWLERIGHLEADAFVEAIPFDEARGYVRKVLRSHAAYRALYQPEAGPWDLPPPHGHIPGPAEVAER